MAKNDYGKLIVSENKLESFILKLPKGLIYDSGKVTSPEGKSVSGYKFALNGVMYCLYYKEAYGFDYEKIVNERNKLIISKENPEILKVLKNKISYFEYGYEEN